MSAPPAKLMVFAGSKFACIKVAGRANFTLAVDLQTLFGTLAQKDLGYFVIDLAECSLMDSTFLGVLAGFGLKVTRAASNSGRQGIELLNPNQRVVELLDNMGILPLFTVVHAAPATPEAMEDCSPEPCRPSKEETTRACLEAHRTLMEINPANAAKFKDVTQYLADELQKLKSEN